MVFNYYKKVLLRTFLIKYSLSLSLFYFSVTSLVSFDAQMNCFSEEEMKKDSVSSKLIQAALTANSVMLKLDNGPQLWQYFDTPLYSKLVKAQNFMEK